MKKFTLLFLVPFLFACGATQPVVTAPVDVVEETVEEVPSNEVIDQTIFSGIVRMYKSPCNVLIELMDSGAKLYPVNLDEMFMVDGAVIEFKFGPTRAMQPEECGSQSKAVAVRDVVRLKQ
jgi:hypothetical protein